MYRSLLSLALVAGLALVPEPASAQAQTQDPMVIARGATLYGQACARCHNPRGAQERTDGEWRVIMLHMRARAVMSRSAAEAITQFLQATNTRVAEAPPRNSIAPATAQRGPSGPHPAGTKPPR